MISKKVLLNTLKINFKSILNKIDNLENNVLIKNNLKEYNPTKDYHPTTVKFVKDSIEDGAVKTQSEVMKKIDDIKQDIFIELNKDDLVRREGELKLYIDFDFNNYARVINISPFFNLLIYVKLKNGDYMPLTKENGEYVINPLNDIGLAILCSYEDYKEYLYDVLYDSIKRIYYLNTSNVTNMNYMFNSYTSLTTIPELDTSSVTSMNYMFSGCTSLTTIPLLDTSSVISMNYMFSGCTSLTTIPLLDTSNTTSMGYVFDGCTSLTTIPLLDTSNVSNIRGIFNNCTSLTTIPLLDISKVGSTAYLYNLFNGCNALTYIKLVTRQTKTTILQLVINELPSHDDTDVERIIDLSEITTITDLLGVTAPSGWTIKLPGGEA